MKRLWQRILDFIFGEEEMTYEMQIELYDLARRQRAEALLEVLQEGRTWRSE